MINSDIFWILTKIRIFKKFEKYSRKHGERLSADHSTTNHAIWNDCIWSVAAFHYLPSAPTLTVAPTAATKSKWSNILQMHFDRILHAVRALTRPSRRNVTSTDHQIICRIHDLKVIKTARNELKLIRQKMKQLIGSTRSKMTNFPCSSKRWKVSHFGTENKREAANTAVN